MPPLSRASALALLVLLGCNPEGDGKGPNDKGDGDCASDVAGEQSVVTLYADLDGDGFTVAEGVDECIGADVPTGYATEPTNLVDCDDTSASINPFAPEIEGDGIDQNCDGEDPIPLPEGVYYVNSADPGCQDVNKGTVEAPNCTLTAAGQLSADGDTIWVAADGDYLGESVNTGRTYLGGYDAAAGWTRDTTSNRTVLQCDWVEPFELFPGLWVFTGTAVAFVGSSPSDTVFEGFEVRGQSSGWGMASTLSGFLLAGQVYIRDTTLVGGSPQPAPTGVDVGSNVSIVDASEGMHFENVLITGGSGDSCSAFGALLGEVTLDHVTIDACADSGVSIGINTSSGTIIATDTTVDVGAGSATSVAAKVTGTGSMFATASVFRVEGSDEAVALEVEGQDARVELKNSVFLASSQGTALGRGARILDNATVIAAASIFDGGTGTDTVGIEIPEGTFTSVNGMISAGSSATATAVKVTALTDVTLVSNNFWSPGPAVILDESGLQVADAAQLDQCGWSACREARLNTDTDPQFENLPGALYSVSPTSPAVDSGVDPSPYGLIVSRDIAGLSAPSDGDGDTVAEFDRGPHER